jgi:hypothetical protein
MNTTPTSQKEQGVYLYIALYLLSVVAANISIAAYGPSALLFVSWVVIPFDLTLKDALQERWTGDGLVKKLGALVFAGSVLSALLSKGSAMVSLASFVAFAVAGTADGFVFHKMPKNKPLLRVNASNVIGALFDSWLFQAIAFGSAETGMVFAQAASKSVGGFVWSLILVRLLSKLSKKNKCAD